MELKIPYYIEYTNLVASFMEEIGRSHGANSEELMQLRLIGEEAFVFILNGIPKVGIQNSFRLHRRPRWVNILFLEPRTSDECP